MLGVGFEPTHLAILELESSALDHSAIQASSAAGRWRKNIKTISKRKKTKFQSLEGLEPPIF